MHKFTVFIVVGTQVNSQFITTEQVKDLLVQTPNILIIRISSQQLAILSEEDEVLWKDIQEN